VGGEKVARPIVSKCLVDQSAQPESDGSMQRFSSNLPCAALSVALGENTVSTTPQNNPSFHQQLQLSRFKL
jgi:hypothetical protein